jgi:hypothetical protein
MRITIHTSDDGATLLETNGDLQRAFVVLHGADIQTRGGGTFADGAAAIILAREADALDALAALKRAGIEALVS